MIGIIVHNGDKVQIILKWLDISQVEVRFYLFVEIDKALGILYWLDSEK